jgi:hypothetical protein
MYIKQVALLVILAQIGCYVSARQAVIAVRDRILSRIGTSDDMEHNLSTFATEMMETAYLTSNLSPRSLVIIDELGRGTSTIDGLSIAMAVAEALLASKAYTLFVTHYLQLTSMADAYPNTKNIHMKTAIDIETAANDMNQQQHQPRMRYLHVLEAGPCDMKSGYGIMMAARCGFPDQTIHIARSYQRILRDQYPLLLGASCIDDTSALARRLFQQLSILRNTRIDAIGIRNFLQSLRANISPQICARMRTWLSTHAASASDSASSRIDDKARLLPLPLSAKSLSQVSETLDQEKSDNISSSASIASGDSDLDECQAMDTIVDSCDPGEKDYAKEKDVDVTVPVVSPHLMLQQRERSDDLDISDMLSDPSPAVKDHEIKIDLKDQQTKSIHLQMDENILINSSSTDACLSSTHHQVNTKELGSPPKIMQEPSQTASQGVLDVNRKRKSVD